MYLVLLVLISFNVILGQGAIHKEKKVKEEEYIYHWIDPILFRNNGEIKIIDSKEDTIYPIREIYTYTTFDSLKSYRYIDRNDVETWKKYKYNDKGLCVKEHRNSWRKKKDCYYIAQMKYHPDGRIKKRISKIKDPSIDTQRNSTRYKYDNRKRLNTITTFFGKSKEKRKYLTQLQYDNSDNIVGKKTFHSNNQEPEKILTRVYNRQNKLERDIETFYYSTVERSVTSRFFDDSNQLRSRTETYYTEDNKVESIDSAVYDGYNLVDYIIIMPEGQLNDVEKNIYNNSDDLIKCYGLDFQDKELQITQFEYTYDSLGNILEKITKKRSFKKERDAQRGIDYSFELFADSFIIFKREHLYDSSSTLINTIVKSTKRIIYDENIAIEDYSFIPHSHKFIPIKREYMTYNSLGDFVRKITIFGDYKKVELIDSKVTFY